MEATIFGTIFFPLSFILMLVSVFQIKKTSNILNGVSWLIISFVSVLCYGAMAAGIINIIKIPVNIISVGIIYTFTGSLLQIIIKKENEKQSYNWELYDFIYIAVFGLIIFFVAGSYFTSSLQLMYYNSDAAVHFKNAMYVLRNESLENMYFAPLHSALIMEVFMPFVVEANLCRVFILIDTAMFFLESVFFMVVIRDFIKTKAMKFLGLIIAVVYMLGYPMNSFLYSFFYWGMGVMIIGYILLMLRYYENNVVDRRVSIIGMMLGCGAIPVTYMLFGPIVFVATFFVLLVFYKRRGKLFCIKNVILALQVFLVPTFLAIYYCYLTFLKDFELSTGEILNLNGGIYRELYIDFIFTLPFVLYMFIKALKNKKLNETLIFTLVMGVFTVVMCVLVYKGKIGAYYFYKYYFPIWLFFYVLTVQAVEDLWKKSKEIIISFGLIFCFLVVMCYGKVEQKIVSSPAGLTSADRSSGLFPVWHYNIMLYKIRTLRYPPEYFEICNYVIEELKDEEGKIPLLATLENYTSCYWYEGITGRDSEEYYGWEQPFDDIKEKIEESRVNYFVVYKDSPMYENNKEFFEEFEYVFENELGFVAKVK